MIWCRQEATCSDGSLVRRVQVSAGEAEEDNGRRKRSGKGRKATINWVDNAARLGSKVRSGSSRSGEVGILLDATVGVISAYHEHSPITSLLVLCSQRWRARTPTNDRSSFDDTVALRRDYCIRGVRCSSFIGVFP